MGYYITSDGKEHPIKPKQVLMLSYKDIIKLVIPDGVEYVHCSGNNLTELILPESIERVYCTNNNLKELILPDSIEGVWCDNINIQDLDRFLNKKDIEIRLYI